MATTSPDMVLTLDDGPDPDQTPQVLEVLAAHDATATFFVLLTRARRHPDLLRAMLAAGHEVALHGPDHRPLTEFGFAAARERTVAARRELEQLAGVRVPVLVVQGASDPFGTPEEVRAAVAGFLERGPGYADGGESSGQ